VWEYCSVRVLDMVCPCNDVECLKCDKLGLLDTNDFDDLEVDLYE